MGGKEAGGASRLLLHPKDKFLHLRSCQVLTMTSSCLCLQQGSSCKTLPSDTGTQEHPQSLQTKRYRNFSCSWIFHQWIFNRKSPVFYSAHSSTQQPNFLLTKKFIRKLSSRSQPWQRVEIAQIISRKPSYNTSISVCLCIPW